MTLTLVCPRGQPPPGSSYRTFWYPDGPAGPHAASAPPTARILTSFIADELCVCEDFPGMKSVRTFVSGSCHSSVGLRGSAAVIYFSF